MIGLLTPPVGGLLYIVSEVAHMRFEVLVEAVLPFLVPLLASLALVTSSSPGSRSGCPRSSGLGK